MLRDTVLAILGLLWAVILVLVGGRFLALLFDANRDSELVQRLMDWSDFWVGPFFDLLGLSNKAVEETGGVFEPASAVAFVVYFVLGSLILGAVRGMGSYGYFRHA
jgi:hypothetical protein